MTCGVRNETSGQIRRPKGFDAMPGSLEGPDSKMSPRSHQLYSVWNREQHTLPQTTPNKRHMRWILILCAWTTVGLLFAGRRILAVKTGGSHVNWVIAASLEFVYWYAWAACTPLVIALAKRFPLTGPTAARHIALHTIASLLVSSLASATDYVLSSGLLRFVFRLTDAAMKTFLDPFVLGLLFMSFTGILTYWLVVGLYQSIHFYRAAIERQTMAAQLESKLSQAELENFNSLHTIGILMQENVDAASHLLVNLGDLLRMALERRENEITLESELEFVGKYLEIEQTRFHDRLQVHMEIPPDSLAVYVPSLALQPLVENAIKHGISVDSTAGRLDIAAKLDNGKVRLCVRDDGPGPAPASLLRFGVGLTNVQSRLKQLYGDEASLELNGGGGRGCEAIITIPLRRAHIDSTAEFA
jgi:two-component system, LytTR family, sensor kinase